mgnify:CR=1 FL=1
MGITFYRGRLSQGFREFRKSWVLLGRWGWILAGGTVFLAAAAAYAFIHYDLSSWVTFLVDENTQPGLFILLMVVCPVFGVPISPFLVIAGIKFGVWGGSLVTILSIPLHLGASFAIAHSLIHSRLQGFLERRGYHLPRIAERRVVPFTIVFTAVPGAPYAFKNYLLALGGVPLRYYLLICWPLEVGLCLPVVGLGGAASEMNLTLSLIFLAAILGIYFLVRWLKKRFGNTLS